MPMLWTQQPFKFIFALNVLWFKKIHSSCFVIATKWITRHFNISCKTDVKWKSESSSVMPWNSPGQNTGVGSLSLLQRLFPTQGSNPGLPYWRRILYQLTHKGSPRILEWAAYSFLSSSSQSRNQTGVSCIANWAIREATTNRHAMLIFEYMKIKV